MTSRIGWNGKITPQTSAYERGRIQLARKGVSELSKFDSASLTETQRVSADLLRWDLETVIGEEPYLDYSFPLQPMNGVNINLVEALTVRHPLANEHDAVHYIAALGQVSVRMDEAIVESRRLAAKKVLPPKFILEATIKQMQTFAAPDPVANPFVFDAGPEDEVDAVDQRAITKRYLAITSYIDKKLK